MRSLALTLLLALGGLSGCISSNRVAASDDTASVDDDVQPGDTVDVEDAVDAADAANEDTVSDTAVADVLQDAVVEDVAQDTATPADTVHFDSATPSDGGGPLVSVDADAGDVGDAGEGDGSCASCGGTLCAPGVCEGGTCVQHLVGRAVDIAGRWVVSATVGGDEPGTFVGVAEVDVTGGWTLLQAGQTSSVHAPTLSSGGDWCSEQDGHVIFTDGGAGAALLGQVDLQDELLVGVNPEAGVLAIAVKRAEGVPELGRRYRLLGLTAAIGGGLAGLSGWISLGSDGCVTDIEYEASDVAVAPLAISPGDCATVADGGTVSLEGSAMVRETEIEGRWHGPLAPSGAVAALYRKITNVGSTIYPGVLLLVREDGETSGLDLPGAYAVAGLDAGANADALWGQIVYGAQDAIIEDLVVERTHHETLSGGGATATDWFQVTEGSAFPGEGMYRHSVGGAELLASVAGQVGPVDAAADRISWLAAVAIATGGEIDAPPAAPALFFAVRKR